MKFEELTYASPNDARLKRWLIQTIEGWSGRERFLPLYRYWRNHIVGKSDRMMGQILDLVDCKLQVDAREWPPPIPADLPLVMVSNHPFGIGDGIAILALAEQLGRPFKVLINNQLLRIPEIRPYSLPIDFEETREAQLRNLRTRKESLKALASGTTIVVFPAGGVATASNPFGKAVDLPWKLFTAKMIQASRAAVLPVWFYGQNGPLFHLVSRLSLTLRLSLLVAEFRRFEGATVRVRVGDLVRYEDLKNPGDRRALTEELHLLVHGLADPALEAEYRRRPAIVRAGSAAKRKVKGVGRLAKMKVKRVGNLAKRRVKVAKRKARVIGRRARQRIDHGRLGGI